MTTALSDRAARGDVLEHEGKRYVVIMHPLNLFWYGVELDEHTGLPLNLARISYEAIVEGRAVNVGKANLRERWFLDAIAGKWPA